MHFVALCVLNKSHEEISASFFMVEMKFHPLDIKPHDILVFESR